MRILHTVSDYTRSGGIGTYLMALVAEQGAEGHDCLVAAATHHSQPEVACDVSWRDVDVVHHHDYWRPQGMPEVVNALTVQSLHNYDFSCSSRTRYLGTATPCLKPHGVACVGNWPRCAHSLRINRLFEDYSATTVKLSLTKSADFVVAYSQHMGKIAKINGIEESKVRVIPCPMSRFAVDPSFKAASPRLVSYFGRLSKPKGVVDLIHAAGEVDIKVRIVGDGYQRGELEALAEKMAPGRVEFFGWADEGQLGSLYSDSTLVVMPGRWPEPFGLVGLEAGWAGRPVVATGTGGVPDWLEDGVTGLSVEPGNRRELIAAIGRLALNRDEASELGGNARRRMETWPTVAEHAAALMKDVYR